MKLIVCTHTRGLRTAFHMDQGGEIFFQDPQPPPDALVTLDFPGLRRMNRTSLVKWLSSRKTNQTGPPADPLTETAGLAEGTAATPSGKPVHPARLPDSDAVPAGAGPAVGPPSRRQIVDLPPTCWRLTVLDDFLDAGGWEWTLWSVEQHIALTEFRVFAERWHADTMARFRGVEDLASAEARCAALAPLAARLQRVYGVLQHAGGRAEHERMQAIEHLDRQRLEALRPLGADRVKDWLSAAEAMETDEVRTEALRELARYGVGAAGTEERARILQAISRRKKLREATQYDTDFWEIVSHHLDLPDPARDLVVDVTNAHPCTVQANWDLFRATRVGPVMPGRSALAVYTERGRLRCYVRGDRTLLFRIRKAGGELRKYGCTLRIQAPGGASLRPMLLEIERLDTLAHVDPAQAVEAVADMGLPPDHLLYRTARAAASDHRQAHLLSDLLIELKYGVDADVARSLVRSQSRVRRF